MKKSQMRIAQVARFSQGSPWQKVVWWLTEVLVKRGHDVSLIETPHTHEFFEHRDREDRLLRWSADDGSRAGMLRRSGIYATGPLASLSRTGKRFDVVHVHSDGAILPPALFEDAPVVATLHGLPEEGVHFAAPLDQEVPPLVTTLAEQQELLSRYRNWWTHIPYGVPPERVDVGRGGESFVYVGSLGEEARLERAIEVARTCGRALTLVGSVQEEDRGYFERFIRPYVDGVSVRLLDRVSEDERYELLGAAAGVIVPSSSCPGAPLVALEAMAAGTPVLSFRGGEVERLVAHGRTGFVVGDTAEAISAALRIDAIERGACREHFERYYTAETMVDRYIDTYSRLLIASGMPRTALGGLE